MSKLYNPFSEKKIDLNNLRSYRDFLQVDKNYLNKSTRCFKLENIEKYSGVAEIIVNGIHFNTLLIPSKSNKSKLYVSLTSGHRNTDVRFVRWKYANFLDGTFLAIDDPMFREFKNIPSDLMGWFYGTTNNNFLLKTGLIIEKIASLFNIPSQNITIIGSSSGGYAATYLGNHIKNCSIIALNPQFILNKWPYAKKLEKVTGLDFNKNDDRNYVNISKSDSRFFFYFNLLSKNDLPQLDYLLTQFKLKISDLNYGVNLISNNVAIWINIVDYYHLHIASPEVYEIMYINYLLDLMNNNININEFNSFSVLLSEMMNQRYQVMDKVHSLVEEKKTSPNQFQTNFDVQNILNQNEILLNEISKIESEHWKNKNFSKVLDIFRIIFQNKYYKCKWSQFTHARFAVTKVYASKKEQVAYWNSLSNTFMNKAYEIGEILKNKSVELKTVQDKFNDFLNSYFDNDEIKKAYNESFKILSSTIYGVLSKEYSDIQIKHKTHIIVSSIFPYSGSRALCDYLSDFSNIQKIPGEFSIIEGNGGFAGFIKFKNDYRSVLNHSIDFFFRNILGCYKIKNPQDFKEMFVSNNFATTNNYSSDFLSSIIDITKCVSNLLMNAKNNKDMVLALKNMANAILNHISVKVPSDRIPLIDNSIHIHNIDIINYVDNVKIISVSCDPRVSYVERIKSDPAYVSSPVDFINSYNKVIDNVRSKLSLVSKIKLNKEIIPVSYEFFVLSDDYKEYILKKIYLEYQKLVNTTTNYNHTNNFQIINSYLTYKDQIEIENIKNSLSDYCIDISDDNYHKVSNTLIDHMGTNVLFKLANAQMNNNQFK